MGEILPKHYIIGIIIFTLITVGGISWMSELRKGNPSAFSGDKMILFNNTFNTYDDITHEVEAIQGNIENQESGLLDKLGLGFLDNLISGAWNSLKLMFQSFGFMNNVFEGVSGFFGVPLWITKLLSLIVTVIIAFAIYAAIFQREI